MHDFVHHVSPALSRLDRLAGKTPRRRPSGLENYVLARLDGERQVPFLDSLELHAAIHSCQIIGAVDVFGRTVSLQRLGGDDWLRAGAAGFKIAAGGPDAVDAFLSMLRNTYARTAWAGPPSWCFPS